jgi:Ca2+-binding RTX toxin-like protein
VSFLSNKVGGAITVDVFDNFLGRTSSAFYIRHDEDDPSVRTVRFGHNAFWKNDGPSLLDGFSLGDGNVNGDPGFVDEAAGKLALTGGSRLIDVGATCTQGGLVNLDAAKRGRLAGTSVDIVAYERGATAPTGVAYVGGDANESLEGTPGADILCGMGGSDILRGFGGADHMDGGGAADVVMGGDGADRVYGGKGDDSCLYVKDGVEGNDLVDGGKGEDQFRADPGDVRTKVEIKVAVCN